MIKLTSETLRAILPRAPQAVIDAFVEKQDLLTKAGINATRARMTFFWANVEHETGGFTIPNLTEDIRYTAGRMAQVWPRRFPGGAAAVQAKFGTGAGWQKKAFDDIYGNRMGNRPGTSDGSTYIGRGGPQWTGRDGYAALERLTGLPAVADPTIATRLDLQPEICVAFWTWKNLNRFADAGDFVGCVHAWNGGENGMADRRHLMAGNDPIIARMENVNVIASHVPDAKKPVVTKEDIAKGVVIGGGGGALATGAHRGCGLFEWSMLGLGVVLAAVVAHLAWRFLLPRWRAYRARQALIKNAAAAAVPRLPGGIVAAPVPPSLPPAASIWESSTKAPRKRRPARKTAAKPKGKKPARKPTNRKVA